MSAIKTYVFCVVLFSVLLPMHTAEASIFGDISSLLPKLPHMESVFQGIRNYFKFPPGANANFVKINNDTYIWRFKLNLIGYNISSINATRRGQFFQITGLKKMFNQNTLTSLGEILPKTVKLDHISVIIQNQTLIAEAPVKEPPLIIIPINYKN